jgi:type I pantothenate kinase
VVHLAVPGDALDGIRQPRVALHHYADLTDQQADVAAREIWRSINRPNLIENILPTRPRATLVLRKDADHSINRLRLRKL